MTQNTPQGLYVLCLFVVLGGVCVPKAVGGDIFGDAGFNGISFDHFFTLLLLHFQVFGGNFFIKLSVNLILLIPSFQFLHIPCWLSVIYQV